MRPTADRIEEIKNNGYQLDFGTVFNHAFENYKKIALYAGLMIFVFSVVICAILSAIAIAVFGLSTLTDFLKPENLKPENLSLTNTLLITGVSILVSCLLSPFPAGLIKMADSAERDEEFHVSTVFAFYKSHYFKELFMATFVISILGSGLSTLFEHYGIGFVGSLLNILISFFTLMSIPLIIFGNLKAVDAISSSIVVVSKQPLVLFALMLVSIIAAFVGLIGFCIGIFFTLPFMYSMYFAIYNSIIGFDSKSELDEIGMSEN
jgi:uncharacterized membrane protein